MDEPKSNNAFQEHFRKLSELVGRFNWNTDDLSFPVTVNLAARRVGKAYNGEPVCSTYSIVQMPTGELNLVMYYGDSYNVIPTDNLGELQVVCAAEIESFRKEFMSQRAVPA